MRKTKCFACGDYKEVKGNFYCKECCERNIPILDDLNRKLALAEKKAEMLQNTVALTCEFLEHVVETLRIALVESVHYGNEKEKPTKSP